MSLPTVDELKAHANITDTASDRELTRMLDATVRQVEKRIGRIDSPVAVSGEVHRHMHSDVLILRKTPVTGLTAVSSRVGATTTALTLADYEVDVESGLVRRVDGGWFSGTYVVSYTTGVSVLDADIELAILVIAEDFWRTQRGVSPSPLDVQDGELDQALQRVGDAIPRRALSLLGATRPVIA